MKAPQSDFKRESSHRSSTYVWRYRLSEGILHADTFLLQGAKIGFLGANGAGKSSLMRILAGEDTQFDGNLNLVPGIRIGYLPQEPVLDDSATVLQNIETAVKPVKDMIKEFEQVGSVDSDS